MTLFNTQIDSEMITLSFQDFRKGGSIFVDVTTRENMLTEADIGYSYKEENILDIKALWINTIIIFVIMVFLSVFFKARKE
jgi:hypothetical protein